MIILFGAPRSRFVFHTVSFKAQMREFKQRQTPLIALFSGELESTLLDVVRYPEDKLVFVHPHDRNLPRVYRGQPRREGNMQRLTMPYRWWARDAGMRAWLFRRFMLNSFGPHIEGLYFYGGTRWEYRTQLTLEVEVHRRRKVWVDLSGRGDVLHWYNKTRPAQSDQLVVIPTEPPHPDDGYWD